MHLSQFIENYVSSWICPEHDPKVIDRFSYSTRIAPTTYLQYAQADLESSIEHRYINALSNAKRAIDCQLDNILGAFGLRKRRSFPQKLEVTRQLGLVAPRIVRKVIHVRNLLEHEYYEPSQGEAEDAVDVATFFLEVTSRPFRSFMQEYFIADRASAQNPSTERIVSAIKRGDNSINGYTFTECFYVQFDTEAKSFWIDCVHDNQQVSEIEICPKHGFYKRLVRFTFDYDFEYHNHSPEEVGQAFVCLMGELANDP